MQSEIGIAIFSVFIVSNKLVFGEGDLGMA
jgi:hypothetical protein